MALPHLVHDGDNGYLFEPDDVQEFSEKLRKILTADQAELDRLSENSLHLIQSHDIERTLSIFEGLYRGDQDSDRTSDDNSETYTQAIGLLPEQLHNRVVELRERAKALREAAAELREEVVEDVREKLEDIRDEVKKSAKKTAIKAKKVVKNATERLKNDED
jgi:dsDNA-specific endonuclease/ATPase MutS2